MKWINCVGNTFCRICKVEEQQSDFPCSRSAGTLEPILICYYILLHSVKYYKNSDRSHILTETSVPQLSEWGHRGWIGSIQCMPPFEQWSQIPVTHSQWLHCIQLMILVHPCPIFERPIQPMFLFNQWPPFINYSFNETIGEWGHWMMGYYIFRCFAPFAINLLVQSTL